MKRTYKAYLLDLDGTVYYGNQRIPSAECFVRRLTANKIDFLLLTNNATRSPGQVVNFLRENCELMIDETQVYTSALAVIDYLKANHVNQSVFVIGEPPLISMIESAGFRIDQTSSAQVVVQALNRQTTYAELAQATLAIRAGAAFIVTNTDANIPTESGMVPSSGAISAFLSYATQREPIVMGKPYAPILDGALRRLGLSKSEVLMVGDNYATDMQVGIQNGVDTLLVLTGITKRVDFESMIVKPTYVVDDLSEWEL